MACMDFMPFIVFMAFIAGMVGLVFIAFISGLALMAFMAFIAFMALVVCMGLTWSLAAGLEWTAMGSSWAVWQGVAVGRDCWQLGQVAGGTEVQW
eukprot:s659_g19.t1